MINENIKFVGELLSIYYPTTLVYKMDNSIFINEWLDVINGDDVFFAYQISKEDLLKYITGKISHLSLFQKAKDDKFYKNNGDLSEIIKETNFEGLNKKSLPLKGVYFDKDYSSDYKTILKEL